MTLLFIVQSKVTGMNLDSLSEQLASALAGLYGWEALAVLLAMTYLLLAVRQNRLCWLAALLSTAIFTALFWREQLLMQSLLNVYYMVMAVYGWWQWTQGSAEGEALPISRRRWQWHALVLAAVACTALISGALLAEHTAAARPYLDSFVTWGAVVTTWMVARKVLENWAWWMVINSLAIVLFLDSGMALTAVLHLAYLGISIFGWRRWVHDYRNAPAAT